MEEWVDPKRHSLVLIVEGGRSDSVTTGYSNKGVDYFVKLHILYHLKWSFGCCNGVKHNIALGEVTFCVPYNSETLLKQNHLSDFLSLVVATCIKCPISWFPFPAFHQKYLSGYVRVHMHAQAWPQTSCIRIPAWVDCGVWGVRVFFQKFRVILRYRVVNQSSE